MVVLCGHPLRGRNRETVRFSTLMYFSHRLYLLIKSSMPKFHVNDQFSKSPSKRKCIISKTKIYAPDMHDISSISRKNPQATNPSNQQNQHPTNKLQRHPPSLLHSPNTINQTPSIQPPRILPNQRIQTNPHPPRINIRIQTPLNKKLNPALNTRIAIRSIDSLVSVFERRSYTDTCISFDGKRWEKQWRKLCQRRKV
jgi:hypothetical protein